MIMPPPNAWRPKLRDGTLVAYLRATMARCKGAPPEALAWFQTVGRDIRNEGNRIVERIFFWREIPVIGSLVTDRLSDRLNKISDVFEEFVCPN